MGYFELLEAGTDVSWVYRDAKKIINDVIKKHIDQLRNEVGDEAVIDQLSRDDSARKILWNISKELSEEFQILVHVEDKADSTDPMRDKSGGYYDQSKNLVKVFLDPYVGDSALISDANRILNFSEPSRLFELIIGTLAHEMSHADQAVRGKDFTKGNDTGLTKSKASHRRDPASDKVGYFGATHELDSFASGAAVEYIENNIWGSMATKSDIKDAIHMIQYGGGRSSSVQMDQVMSFIDEAIAGEHGDISEKEIRDVKKRFLKYLVSKLEKMVEPPKFNAPKEWISTIELARKNGWSLKRIIDRITDYIGYAAETDMGITPSDSAYDVMSFLYSTDIVPISFERTDELNQIIQSLIRKKMP